MKCAKLLANEGEVGKMSWGPKYVDPFKLGKDVFFHMSYEHRQEVLKIDQDLSVDSNVVFCMNWLRNPKNAGKRPRIPGRSFDRYGRQIG